MYTVPSIGCLGTEEHIDDYIFSLVVQPVCVFVGGVGYFYGCYVGM